MIHAMPGKAVIVIDEIPEKTVGGLYIPDNAREDANVGTIISINNENFEHTLKEGDRVLVGKYGGVKVTYDDRHYVIFKIEEILAFIAPCTVPS